MYTFIINPNSRSGLGKAVWRELEPTIKTSGIEYTAFFTKYQGHATRYVKALTSDRADHTLVILGGDGTINEVLNGIVSYENITLGYIPIGSSNDFARGFRLPTDPVKALNIILKPTRFRMLDVGVLSYGNKTRNFAVSAGIGFDAAICHQAVVSKLKLILNRLKLGKLTYAAIALNRLFLDDPVSISLSLDKKEPITYEKAYFAAIMNHAYEGGGFKFCPNAKPDDRMLDIIVIAGISKLKILCLLPTAFRGFHVHFKGVHVYQCREAEISTSRALAVHTDGEPVFLQRHIRISQALGQVRVING